MRVVEVFDSLQGEGVWAGVPMTFVRLAGCNAPELGLDCAAWCDTRYAWSGEAGTDWTLEELVRGVRLPRCCITGGEPLLQQEEVARLVAALHERGVLVHLETNGTVEPRLEPLPDWITVSPKPPAYAVGPLLAAAAHEVKLIVTSAMAAEGVEAVVTCCETVAARFARAQVCLQPEVSGGPELGRRVAEAVMSRPGWRLSLQLHTILGLR